MTKPTIYTVARSALDYIDAIPADVVANLPTMPGFDRDWAEQAIAGATESMHVTEQSDEHKHEIAAYEATVANLEQKVAALAAENAGLKTHREAIAVDNAALREVVERMINQFAMNGISPEERSINPAKSLMFDAKSALFMPATDAAIAEVRTAGRVEGVNFAAGRLAAAFNHGFIDKPMAEVFDVVRMILTAKEDLATTPAEDGLSGEYAEQALRDWEEQLRAEASK